MPSGYSKQDAKVRFPPKKNRRLLTNDILEKYRFKQKKNPVFRIFLLETTKRIIASDLMHGKSILRNRFPLTDEV